MCSIYHFYTPLHWIHSSVAALSLLYISLYSALYCPSQNVMQVNVHLSVGKPQPVPDGQVLAIVGQVGVPGGSDLCQHCVQAHEVDCRVDAATDNKSLAKF